MRQDKCPPKLFDYVLQKDSGNVFYLPAEKLFGRKSRPDIDKIIHSAGDVIRLSVSFENRKAEVKYSQDSSLPRISNHLQSLDCGTRMEIFSQECDEDVLIRILATESLRSVLFKPGQRLTWKLGDIREYFKRYGAIQEIHYFFDKFLAPNHTPSEAIITFKMQTSANTCVESFQQMRNQLPFTVELLQPSVCWLQSQTQESRIGQFLSKEDSSNLDNLGRSVASRNKKRGSSCPPFQTCIIDKRSRHVDCATITEEHSFNSHLTLMLLNSRHREEMSNKTQQDTIDSRSLHRPRSSSADLGRKQKTSNCNRFTEPEPECTAELLLYSESAEAVSRNNYLLCGLLHTVKKKFEMNQNEDEEFGLYRSFLSSSCLSDGISADEPFIQESEDSGPSVAPVTAQAVQPLHNSPMIIRHTSNSEDPFYHAASSQDTEGQLAGAISSSKCYRFSRRQPLITFFAFPDEGLLCSSPHSSRIETLLNYSPRY